MFGSILHRMILWELVKVFLIALLGITGILLMAGIIAEASQQGLGPAQILEAIPLLIPSTLPYTIPATTLFAACVVYGRLSADNEILAIRAAGINLAKVVKPGLILGLAMSMATMGLYYQVIPYTHLLLRSMVFNDAEELLYSLLKKHHMIKHSQLHCSMFVRGVQDRKLLFPIFKRFAANNRVDAVASAQEAELRVSTDKKTLLIYMKNGDVTMEDGSPLKFKEYIFEQPLPEHFGNEADRRPRDMVWEEIYRRRRALEEEIETIRREMAAQTSLQLMNNVPIDLPQHLKNLQERLQYRRLQIVALDVELLMRPALSLGCFCFILVGCPVGIWFSRSDYLSSFITCFLPIVFIYYPLILCGTGMAKEGRLNPIPLVWAADIVIGTIGLGLFWRLLRN